MLWKLCRGFVGLWGAKQGLTGQKLCVGSVGSWWSAGGLWNIFTIIYWLSIAGAFPKFAIFENRIFLKRDAAKVKFISTDFLFFHGFDI